MPGFRFEDARKRTKYAHACRLQCGIQICISTALLLQGKQGEASLTLLENNEIVYLSIIIDSHRNTGRIYIDLGSLRNVSVCPFHLPWSLCF